MNPSMELSDSHPWNWRQRGEKGASTPKPARWDAVMLRREASIHPSSPKSSPFLIWNDLDS